MLVCGAILPVFQSGREDVTDWRKTGCEENDLISKRNSDMSQSGGNNAMVFVTAMTIGVGIIVLALYLSGVLST